MPRRLFAVVVLVAGAVVGVLPGRAQGVLPGLGVPDSLSPAATASLLTILPGEAVYSRFGHTALRIHDPLQDLDRTYNYGTFDFNQPFFLLRFARGQLDYTLSLAAMPRLLRAYAMEERTFIEQRLNLPPATVQRLFGLLEENLQPANRTYRYDFFFDNCATRPLVILERALGAPLALPEPAEAETFRALLAPYLAGDPLLAAGIGLGLGQPADRAATARERMFLPLELMNALDRVQVEGQPLVAARDTLLRFDAPPPARGNWLLGAAWLLAALTLAATVAGRLRRLPAALARRAPRADALLWGTVGGAGVVLLLLWLGTEHRVTGPNWNLLWAWPTHLAAPWLRGRVRRVYLGAAGGAALLAGLGAALLPQTLPAVVLPLAVVLAVRGLAAAAEPPVRTPAVSAPR